MMELNKPSASETAIIMENSFRALNIAFIDEWSKFAEIINIVSKQMVDLVIDYYDQKQSKNGEERTHGLRAICGVFL